MRNLLETPVLEYFTLKRYSISGIRAVSVKNTPILEYFVC